jgi:ribose transport system ATP-binding protein
MAEETVAPRFEMRGIRKAFGATLAVDGVDLFVAPGEVCAIVGQNGAGKSTLMAILAGALPADAGTMWLDGARYHPADPHAARTAGVAMIHQELSIAPHLSVAENILLGMEPSRLGMIRRDEMRRKARAALERLGHPEIGLDDPAGTLSPAGQQLVEIARALAVGCRVLVLDEPTSSLTRTDTDHLFAVIRELQRSGHAIVYISHFIEEVKAIADRIVVLRDGKLAGGGPASTLAAPEIVRLMVGRSVDTLYPRSPRARGEAILDLSELGAARATFTLHRGEIIGIAGLLGAGRTRFLRSLFGLEPVRSGRVRLATYTGPAAPRDRWRQGMGFLSEDRKQEGLASALSIADNMTLTRLDGLGPGPFVVPSRQQRAAAAWMERLSIRARGPRQPVSELSGGNQQKVAMARLLHHDVDVLVLDEPTRGIAEASVPRPKAVLMVSSYLPELLGLCDRVAVMCRGTLSAPRVVDERLTEHELMLQATGAGDAA